MRTVKTIIICAFAAILCSCGQKTGTAWLSGEFVSDAPSKVSISVYPRGAEMFRVRGVPVSGGKFFLEVPDVAGAAEVEFLVGDFLMGASLVPGDTLHMTISPIEGSENFACEFAGKSAEASRVFNAMAPVYDDLYSLYKTSDNFTECLEKFEANSADFHTSHDAELDRYFKHLADVKYADMKTTLLSYIADENETDVAENEEYKAIVTGIDPNDPALIGSSLVANWLDLACETDENLTETGKSIQKLQCLSGNIKNPVIKKEQLAQIATSILSDGEDTDAESVNGFWKAFTEAAADFPELIEENQESYEQRIAMAKGTPVKDFNIQTPDGKELALSTLYGKVLYVDIWATWCGPCRGEIPYLAQVAEHYAGSEDVYVMSVSCDETPEPWLEMITADKPAWPQYYVSRENMKALNEGFNVKYIPRFLIIDKEGKIFNAYAPRPSSEDVYTEIDSCVTK